jgi:hypothetical protein
MVQNNVWTLSQPQGWAQGAGAGSSLSRIAAARFRQAQFRAQVGRLRASLLGRSNRLLHLGSLKASASLRNARYAGLRSVPIRHIRGSEGRCDDFDADFRPLKTHNRSRWVGLAAAWLRGAVLPPVALIQVGDLYFVRDGHHRISVARALGQEQIDAEVTVWDLASPVPWDLHGPVVQAACTF